MCSSFTRFLLWMLFAGAVWNPTHAQVAPPRFDMIPGFAIGEDGELEIDGLRISAGYINSSWKFQGQGNRSVEVDPDFPKKSEDAWLWRAEILSEADGTVVMDQLLRPLSDQSWEVRYRQRGDSIPVEETCLRILLPMDVLSGDSVLVDGERVALPKELEESRLFFAEDGNHRILLPGLKGELSIAGKFSVLLQDLREWGNEESFQMRLSFTPNAPVLTDESLDLRMDYRLYVSQPVSIRDVANRGLVDEIAGDGQGGWTDQGPDLDLADLEPGELFCGPIQFEVIDPESNENRAALVLGSRDEVERQDVAE
ncbi:MAG: hypothetical protein ACQKBT_02765, partial [Puniceicoccales bacterium]